MVIFIRDVSIDPEPGHVHVIPWPRWPAMEKNTKKTWETRPHAASLASWGSISYIGNAINGYFQWIDDHPSLLIQLWTMASYRVPEKSWDAMVFLRVSGWFEDEVTRISENQYLQQAHPSDKTATMIMFGSYTFVAHPPHIVISNKWLGPGTVIGIKPPHRRAVVGWSRFSWTISERERERVPFSNKSNVHAYQKSKILQAKCTKHTN